MGLAAGIEARRMTRTERRAARLAVIAAEREFRQYGYAKRAALKLNLTQEQVKRLAQGWLICRAK